MTIISSEFGAVRIIWPDGFPVEKRLNLTDLLQRALKRNGESSNGKVPTRTARKDDRNGATTQLG